MHEDLLGGDSLPTIEEKQLQTLLECGVELGLKFNIMKYCELGVYPEDRIISALQNCSLAIQDIAALGTSTPEYYLKITEIRQHAQFAISFSKEYAHLGNDLQQGISIARSVAEVVDPIDKEITWRNAVFLNMVDDFIV